MFNSSSCVPRRPSKSVPLHYAKHSENTYCITFSLTAIRIIFADIPIVPTLGNKLWEATATARTIGMPNNGGMRRQPPPGEVGRAKLLSQIH